MYCMRVVGGNESDQALEFRVVGTVKWRCLVYASTGVSTRQVLVSTTGTYGTDRTRTAVTLGSMNQLPSSGLTMNIFLYSGIRTINFLSVTDSASFSVKFKTASTGVSCNKYLNCTCCTPEHGNVNDCDGDGMTPLCQN